GQRSHHMAQAYGHNETVMRRISGVPEYTRNLDAALSVVPEGYDWIVAHTNGGLTIHACVGGTKEIFGTTPALALCAAALLARITSVVGTPPTGDRT
ncbi:MAG: hypothetical protein ACYCZX_20995, partial [Rhodospirillaceae bacterium]